MKRHLFYLLALMMTFTASCSKEPEGLDTTATPAVEGKYRLASLSASLDDTETRTGEPNATTGVVNWSAKDRILIVRTSDYAQWQYELVKGANSPIGEFEPVVSDSKASSNDPAFGDLIAVYPVAAAHVDASAKTLSFRINQNWYPENADEAAAWKEQMADFGITAWNKDTAQSFAQNDIKVSYKCTPKASSTNSSNMVSANFKFRQLGAWCKFEFDFSADENIAMESMQSIRVTTVDGNVRFTGESRVRLADDTNANPTLESAGDGTEVFWQFNSPSSMSSRFTRSMMMFPGELNGQRLKIVAETNLHTFTFYATPKQALQAGTVYHFPISLGFQSYGEDDMAAAQATDLAYTMVEKGGAKPFFYYGEYNSYIVKPNVAETIYCTPYKTDPYYHKTGTLATLDADNKPTQAKVIWYESAMGTPVLGAFDASNYTFTVTTPAGKYGNALVGVYNAAGKILWSYHIWVPQDDPTKTLTYANTKSGSYEVMPMALGATKIAVKGEAQTADKRLDGAGLWYQWGRKDPLGRPSYWGNGTASTPGSVAVTVNANTVPGIDAVTDNGFFFTEQNAGANNVLSVPDEMVQAGYAEDGQDGLTYNQVEETLKDGTKVQVTADRHMIEVTTENPTKFAATIGSVYGNRWMVISNFCLWGNPNGEIFPRISQTYKSVFDPCPKGYRVAPMDIWTNFSTQDTGATNIYQYNAAGPISGANRGVDFYYSGMGTTTYDGITPIGYTPPTGEDVATDFYPLTGVRNAETGKPHLVGNYIYFGSSYQHTLRATAAGEVSLRFYENLGRARQLRCVAEPAE